MKTGRMLAASLLALSLLAAPALAEEKGMMDSSKSGDMMSGKGSGMTDQKSEHRKMYKEMMAEGHKMMQESLGMLKEVMGIVKDLKHTPSPEQTKRLDEMMKKRMDMQW